MGGTECCSEFSKILGLVEVILFAVDRGTPGIVAPGSSCSGNCLSRSSCRRPCWGGCRSVPRSRSLLHRAGSGGDLWRHVLQTKHDDLAVGCLMIAVRCLHRLVVSKRWCAVRTCLTNRTMLVRCCVLPTVASRRRVLPVVLLACCTLLRGFETGIVGGANLRFAQIDTSGRSLSRSRKGSTAISTT